MSAPKSPVAGFDLGRLLATPNALAHLTPQDILNGIQRHHAGDWGDVDEEDRQANERALIDGSRLFSVYHSAKGVKYWIITEAGSAVSTVLLPEDY